jgi:hypothetical protein
LNKQDQQAHKTGPVGPVSSLSVLQYPGNMQVQGFGRQDCLGAETNHTADHRDDCKRHYDWGDRAE